MTKNEFKNLLERGKKAYDKAAAIEQELFNKLENDMGLNGLILEDIPTNAENADNIQEAITCYLQYGEYDADSIWDDLILGNQAHS